MTDEVPIPVYVREHERTVYLRELAGPNDSTVYAVIPHPTRNAAAVLGHIVRPSTTSWYAYTADNRYLGCRPQRASAVRLIVAAAHATNGGGQ